MTRFRDRRDSRTIDAAADLLERRGVARGRLVAYDTGQVCPVGALALARGLPERKLSQAYEDRRVNRLCNRVADALGLPAERRGYASRRVFQWSDQTPATEVVAGLRRAASVLAGD